MRRITLALLGLLMLLDGATAQSEHPTASSELKILSWNIYMLPSLIYASTKKKARAEGIIEELNKTNYNIIVFQEAFHAPSRRRLWKGLKDKFPYQYGPANMIAISFKTNSGIWILSDRPLEEVGEIAYDDCEGDGCLARKGVLMVEGEHQGHRFQVLGTHNNGGKVNDNQFAQLREEMLEPYRKDGVPQLICGDFNTKKYSPNNQWQLMMNQFDADTTLYQYDDRSKDHKQTLVIESVYTRMPDFIFVRTNDCNNLKVNRISTVSFGPTWVQGPSKKVFGETVGYSDHYPVQISLQFD